MAGLGEDCVLTFPILYPLRRLQNAFYISPLVRNLLPAGRPHRQKYLKCQVSRQFWRFVYEFTAYSAL